MAIGVTEIDLGSVFDLGEVEGTDTIEPGAVHGVSDFLGSVQMYAFRNDRICRTLLGIRLQDERAEFGTVA